MTLTINHLMPEPVGITSRPQFGQALTVLRERAGFTIRDIARAVDIPVATAGDYFAGRTLPPVKTAGVLSRVLRLCGVTDGERIEEWSLALIRVRRGAVEQVVRGVPPYRGLAPYRTEDADWLFGRDELVRALPTRLAECRGRRIPLVVTGPAGSGKSSVLRAGLLPKLAEPSRLMTPGRCPCRRLADQLCALLSLPVDLVDHALHGEPERIEALARTRADRSVLVIDQFEELFTVGREAWAPGTFLAALSALARSGMGVVIGARDLAGLTSRWPRGSSDATLLAASVGPMNVAQLREIIEAPASRARAAVEPGLVEALVADAAGVPDPLPSLSHALLATWRRRENAALTMRAYRATGGVDAAVRRSVELVYAGFTERQQELAARLFDDLRAGPVVGSNRTGELGAVVDGFVAEGLLARDADLIKVTQDVVLRTLHEK